MFRAYWVAVKELNLSNYIGEATLFFFAIYIYIHYGNLIEMPEQRPSLGFT